MSKEVKRYDWAWGGMDEADDGNYVLASDYNALLAERDRIRREGENIRLQWKEYATELVAERDALLAERDAMKRVLRDARDVIATALKAGAPDWFETEEDIATHTTIKKIDAALHGAQP